MTAPEPQPEPGEEGWWAEMAFACNYGLIEPAEGTAEAEAFRQMNEYARREVERVAEANERDAAYTRRKAAREADLEAGQ
ncbi:MAG: hypothetical protein ACLP8X_24365 [Streptosporangiaceae bacterium]